MKKSLNNCYGGVFAEMVLTITIAVLMVNEAIAFNLYFREKSITRNIVSGVARVVEMYIADEEGINSDPTSAEFIQLNEDITSQTKDYLAEAGLDYREFDITPNFAFWGDATFIRIGLKRTSPLNGVLLGKYKACSEIIFPVDMQYSGSENSTWKNIDNLTGYCQ